ncbi:hypothetical protein ACMA1D_01180 [Streptomyces sp. 796.1]|uniref:hypothetical protein n=1 Tax=Streptomyces sp. 796.1 TaxID=3163029 RepID=UPI0039C8F70E
MVWAAAGGLAAATLIGVAAARSSSGEAEAGRTTREAAPARTGGQETGAPAGSGGRTGRPADATGDGGADEAGETAGAVGEGRDGREHGTGRRVDGQRPADGRDAPAPRTQGPRATPSPGGATSPRPQPTRGGPNPGRGPAAGAGTPLTVSTRSHVWENGCDHRYLVDREPTAVAPPPVEQDAPGWAAAHGAVHGGTTNVEVTVAGRSDRAVVLRGLQVRVVGRQAPLAWPSFAMENGCGGSLTPRAFAVDLDAARPLAKPTDGNDGGRPLPAVRFPYRVSATDPEVLRVNARTVDCDCQWYLELDWTSGDRQGTVRIDDGGRPFRTSGLKGRPEYGYWSSEGGWIRDGS